MHANMFTPKGSRSAVMVVLYPNGLDVLVYSLVAGIDTTHSPMVAALVEDIIKGAKSAVMVSSFQELQLVCDH